VCGSVNPVTQVVVFVPEGQTMIYLRNSDTHKMSLETAISNSTDLSADQKTFLLNDRPWTKVGKLQSRTLYSYREFPIPGMKTDCEKFDIVTFTDFQKNPRNGYGQNSTAIYHPHDERMVFSKAMSGDRFVTFRATVLPEKIDVSQVSDWPDYTISSPVEAERLLVLATLKELMPITSELLEHFEILVDREKRKVNARVPRNTESFSVEPKF
jgi:hypothetical protein